MFYDTTVAQMMAAEAAPNSTIGHTASHTLFKFCGVDLVAVIQARVGQNGACSLGMYDTGASESLVMFVKATSDVIL